MRSKKELPIAQKRLVSYFLTSKGWYELDGYWVNNFLNVSQDDKLKILDAFNLESRSKSSKGRSVI